MQCFVADILISELPIAWEREGMGRKEQRRALSFMPSCVFPKAGPDPARLILGIGEFLV